MSAAVLHPDLPVRDLALPYLLVHDLPFWVGALGLAAVFSAEVSASDAILFMLATSLSQDLYKRFINPLATDRQVLPVARAASAFGGVAAIMVAFQSQSVIDAVSVFYILLAVTFFVPVVAGLYARRARPIDALAAIAGGILMVMVAKIWRQRGADGHHLPVYGLAGAFVALQGSPRFSSGGTSDEWIVRSHGKDRGRDRRRLGDRRGDRARLCPAGRARRRPRPEAGSVPGDRRAGRLRLGRRGPRVQRDRSPAWRRHRGLHAGGERPQAHPQIQRRRAVVRARRQHQGELPRAARRRPRDDRAERRAASSSSRRSARRSSSPASPRTPRPRPVSCSSRGRRPPSSGRTACA